jgi:hypothetical protein
MITRTCQRYEFPESSLGTPMKSGGSLYPNAKSSVRSTHEVASMLTIAIGLRRHGIPTQWHVNVLPRCQLPRHLEKEKKTRVNNL